MISSDTTVGSLNASDGLKPTREEAIAAAKQFEAIFVQMLVKDLRESSKAFGEGLFGKAVGSDIHDGWFDTMMSERLADSGRIGFAESIVRDWGEKGRLADEGSSEAPSTAIQTYAKVRALNEARTFEALPAADAVRALTPSESKHDPAIEGAPQ